MFDFEKFPICVLAEDLYQQISLRIMRNDQVHPSTSNQLARAVVSIAANVAEGMGRFTKPDKRRFFIIARGSLFESVAILRLLKREKSISDAIFSESYKTLENIARMLAGLINYTKC